MRRNNMNMENVVRKLAMCCLLLFAFVGSAAAQNDPWHVIKKGDHYLAHVGTYDSANDTTIWTLQDATSFNPETCLWHSGNTVNVLGLHHNYYFVDTYGNYRFLSAPLLPNGQLSLSATLPSIQLLRNTDQIYYFYDWDPDEYGDRGVARGHKYAGVTSPEDCASGHSWSNEDQECWEVYWVEYDDTQTEPTWKLSGESSYHIPTYGARYRPVTLTVHNMEISNETGGLSAISVPNEMVYSADPLTSEGLSATVSNYSYTYIPGYASYSFEGGMHNWYDDGQGNGPADHGSNTPGSITHNNNTVVSYQWTISGAGASYLSFDSENDVSTTDLGSPTLYYLHENTTGHVLATITLTVTYSDDATQTQSATVLVKTSCHHPGQASAPVITYEDVTVSWYPTSESYTVSWKVDDNSVTTWSSAVVGNVTSYAIIGLAYDTDYKYKVEANCSNPSGTVSEYTFHTLEEPGLLVYGAVYGGGRMADVGGKTEVAIINCDSIHAVYGGNDIAGTVLDAAGATVTLGVEADDPNGFDDYGITNAPIRIGDVYGGGNGYYAYDGTSFVAASYNTVYQIAHNASILELTPEHQGDTVWTNTDSSTKDLVCPTITKTHITVTNDYVKIDSLFGGAKNAILNATIDDVDVTITIDGGTIFSVFGGNNFGGSLGYKSQEHIVVNHTTTATDTYHTGVLGRDFGIGYLFGGGNMVQGQNVYITMNGGQCDTVFGGGNEADVRSTEVKIQCEIGALSNGAYGQVYTDALNGDYSGGNITDDKIKGNYAWDRSGIYNVRTLFGGNNRASMEDGVPNLILTSGGIGTVYGGGNEGDMLAAKPATITFDGTNSYGINYGTHVQMNSPKILIDYLYGGCQKSNVDYSTLVELQEGFVGTVYGGCNISGDVGSKRVNLNVPSNPPTEQYQEVQGSTYVRASGGIVYNNLFGGSNGFYHCNNGIEYIEGVNYCPPENYVGWAIPTHNETHVIMTANALVKGNVYAGGNMSPVGFTDATVGERTFPVFVGLASLHMDGGVVYGDVYGGGNMASILGSNEVRVSGGSIGMSGTRIGALYGGNDRSGQAGQISNRVFPASYNIASDGYTSLTDVNTYVSVTGKPDINTVYGGGNGDYDYVNGDEVIPAGKYCSYDETGNFNDKPIQTNTFVDINLVGNNNDGHTGGHINTVYGGGNGVTVTGSITVFLNVEDPIAYDHVDTIFGGNNKDNIVETNNAPLVPDIILLHGQVGTVYGGCNRGAMKTGKNFTIDGNTYYNVGSMVRLRSSYPSTNGTVTPDAVVSKAVYGGCRMNDVDKNSLVLVEGGAAVPNTAKLFGGCDISGAVGDTSLVVVTGGQVNGNIYAGGNGYYTYSEGTVSTIASTPIVVATGVTNDPPTSRVSRIGLLGGNLGTSSNTVEVFGGGYGQPTKTLGDVIVNVGPATATSWTGLPVIYGDVYGGSAYGDVNTSDLTASYATTSTTVNFLNGTLHGNLYGGGLGRKDDPDTNVNEAVEAKVYGKVFVNISNEDQPENKCFIDLREGNVYGCNNYYGSPQDTVSVHVWKTAFNFSDYQSGDKYKATYTESDADYAIHQVFGGGHEANYEPKGGENTKNKAMVYVHNCLNTIYRVFSGGDAAAAVGLVDTIQGGRMQYVFGGGNGEVTAANVGNGGTHLVVTGGTITQLFGGSNQRGNIAGEMYTEVNNDSGCTEDISEFFGGSNLAPLNTTSGVYSIIKCGAKITDAYGGSNLTDIEGSVTFDVRGGTITNVFGGSKGQEGTTADDAADISRDVTLNLEGGKITNAFGGTNINGNIAGSITVNVLDFGLEDCGLNLENVYGAGRLTPYTPTNATNVPVVNVMHIAQAGGITGNVFGGAYGELATVTANPIVNIGYVDAMSIYLSAITDVPATLVPANFTALVSGNVYGGGELADVTGSTTVNVNNGTVVHKVVGGGKQADITANTNVNIKGGTIGTDGDATTGLGKGVYGGCDVSGNVGGNTIVDLTGGTIGVSTSNTANIHGGGYGNGTTVTGNVTVYFGDNTNIENTGLVLYGDVYGGSALGDVNTADQLHPGETTTTTVILRNGVINGSAYGGGLGQKSGEGGATADDPAYVYGVVYVKVGDAINPNDFSSFTGQANLVNCNVYGCNNLCGSPQSDVYVDVYQTAHTNDNLATNHASSATYAINQVFGGGNRANYLITGKKDNIWIHGCSNTIRRTFGGGDAADVYGVDIHIDGGRFDIIFGGGNGENYEANIGAGGINLAMGGGYINTLVNGSNLHGTVSGGDANIHSTNYDSGCEDLVVNEYYLGSNQADIFGDINVTINCIDAGAWQYKKLYCGSRWSQIYGNINVTIEGGTFENVFGGSKGRLPNPNTVPDPDPGYASNILIITEAMVSGPDAIPQLAGRTDLVGHGGNVSLTINGGSIGNLYGACDENGNIDGKVSVVVEEKEGACSPIFIGDIYGGGNHTDYVPTISSYAPTNANAVPTPNICILKASQIGGRYDFNHDGLYQEEDIHAGNVFGGGNLGNVTSNPKVIVGKGMEFTTTPVNILGNVFGGGNEGHLNGSPQVIVVPETHDLSYTASYHDGSELMGKAFVYNGIGTLLNENGTGNSNKFGEGVDVRIKAIASVYGWKFTGWMASNGIILNSSDATTLFTMGTSDETATITASFESVPVRPLSISPTLANGSISATDGFGETVTLPAQIGIGAVLNILAVPHENYRFVEWSVEGNGSIENPAAASTTFTMGTGEGGATISAIFELKPQHGLTIQQPDHGTITVTNGDTPVSSGASIYEGTVLNIVASNPASNYTFGHWTVSPTSGGTIANSINNPTTTFTMGTTDATLSAEFVPTHQVTFTIGDHGTVTATDGLGNTVNLGGSVTLGEGAVLNLVAHPEEGYSVGWAVSGNGTLTETTGNSTTFTMGTETGGATITVTFTEP